LFSPTTIGAGEDKNQDAYADEDQENPYTDEEEEEDPYTDENQDEDKDYYDEDYYVWPKAARHEPRDFRKF
jgi:hypothetical protein